VSITKPRNMLSRQPREAGFTLVVIAALFIAFAVIASVAVERNTTVQLITRRDSANEQLTKLNNAIIEYAVFNQSGGTLRYPCPARTDLPTTDPNFGVSVNNAGTQDCNTTDYTGVTALNSNVIRGMVPVQTLSQYGLGVNDAFDPWNNRIMYVVNRQLTKGSSVAAATAQPNNPTLRTTVVAAQSLVPPDYLLLSYGRDGVGGIRRESTTVGIGCTNATTKPRFINCDNNTEFVSGPTYTSANATDTTYFDDNITNFTQTVLPPVPGVCNNSAQFACTAGNPTTQNPGSCGGNSTWICAGTGGGADSGTCTFANAACAVNGLCNNSVQYACSAGTSTANVAGSCGGNSTWTCTGSGGGSNDSCSKPNAACVVNGVCNNSTPLGCSAGSATGDNGQTSCGTTRNWTCAGSGGGSNSGTCSFANAACPINGVCNNSTPLGCSAGSATSDNGQTSCGTTRTWVCAGANGGSNSGSCSFTNAACPVNGACNNSTPLGCSAGSATSDNGQTSCGTNRTWVCAGANGGSNSSTCTFPNAACPISGVCNNSTPLGCSAGSATSDNGQTSCGTNRTWVCAGVNGGSNSGTCSFANAACPVNGVCNNSTPLGCSAGSATSDNGQTSCGTNRTWVCAGANGGSNSGTCSFANAACPVNGVCNNSVALGCTAGSATSDNGQTACGTTRTWTCAGANGGSNASCSMANAPCYKWVAYGFSGPCYGGQPNCTSIGATAGAACPSPGPWCYYGLSCGSSTSSLNCQ
jgi:hypothetical protein